MLQPDKIAIGNFKENGGIKSVLINVLVYKDMVIFSFFDRLP